MSFKSFIGNPASEILNYASSIKADLIILASRGTSGGGLWPLGNMADKDPLIAYNIWKTESCRDGHDCEHRFRAETL